MRRKVDVDEIFGPGAAAKPKDKDSAEESLDLASAARATAADPAAVADDKADSREAGKSSSRQDAPPTSRRAGGSRSEEKLTVYVPTDVRAQLDIAKARLRSEHGLRATYSEIVTAALSSSFEDLGELSDRLEGTAAPAR